MSQEPRKTLVKRCLANAAVDAYERLSKYTVLPLENTIYGSVNETLECLFTHLDYESRKKEDSPYIEGKTIVATLDLPISHCLVVKKGTLRSQIKWVRSHEQVGTFFPPQHITA